MTVICSEREEFITFEIWIFIFQKCMELLQGAFIHPWSRVRDVLLRMRVLYFMSSELDPANTHLVPWKGLKGPGQFFI